MTHPPPPEPMTFWRSLVREFAPDMSDEEINVIIAKQTSWPLAATEIIVAQVEEYMRGEGYRRISE